MQFDWLIIDGYNLLYKDRELAGLLSTDADAARHRLIRMIEPAARELATRITVVFDGKDRGTDPAVSSLNLEVVFSPASQTADTLIERLAFGAKKPRRILVVTSDYSEERTVSSVGAQVMSAEAFWARCRVTESRSGISPSRRPANPAPKLGDFFPE